MLACCKYESWKFTQETAQHLETLQALIHARIAMLEPTRVGKVSLAQSSAFHAAWENFQQNWALVQTCLVQIATKGLMGRGLASLYVQHAQEENIRQELGRLPQTVAAHCAIWGSTLPLSRLTTSLFAWSVKRESTALGWEQQYAACVLPERFRQGLE